MVKFFSVVCLALAVAFTFNVQADSQQDQSNTVEIRSVVSGAVENTGWMKVADKQEMEMFLGQYFTGELLAKLTKETWNFVKLNTDWYGTTSIEKMMVNSIDGNTVRVLAYIKEVDVANKTSTGFTGEFTLTKTPVGWRISQMTIRE